MRSNDAKSTRTPKLATSTSTSNHAKTSNKLRSSQRRTKATSSSGLVSLLEDSDDGFHIRSSHNQVEKNYRNRLACAFSKLLEAVEDYTLDEDGLYGQRSLTKNDVLNLARKGLTALGEENKWLKTELQRVKGWPCDLL